ncbi:MAG: glucose-1-phosphate adenylyltransferase [Candidatus Zipacnadales bacterium]
MPRNTSPKVLTLILAGGKGERLRPITEHRAKPAVPFGGVYRIIDFALSNCLNSNLRRIIVLTQYQSLPLSRHLRSQWNILNRELDEFIDMLPPQQRLPNMWYRGTADAILQNLHILEQERPERVLILGGDHVYKMDYQALLGRHVAEGAAVSVGCIDVPIEDAKNFGVMQVTEDHQIVGFQEKPEMPTPMPERPDRALASMGIYVFETEVLVRALIDDAKAPASSHDFGADIIPRLITDHKVLAYNLNSPEQPGNGYWRDVGTLDSYWHSNMDLVARHPEIDLYDESWPIRSGLGHRPPAKVCVSTEGTMGVVEQSIVAPGTVISGGTVRRSVIGPRVEIHNGSEVDECVVMGGVKIGKYVRIRRTIIEEKVEIPDGTIIGFDRDADRRRFKVSEGGIAVVTIRSPI